VTESLDLLDGLPAAADGLEPLARLLVCSPALTARLRDTHVDDGTGHCRACDVRGLAHQIWPCSIHNLAVRAAAYEIPQVRLASVQR
jgi:hypothetical protein